VKRITVSVPDDVYRNARVAAAQRDTSLSAMVVEYLERLSGRMDEFSRLEDLQHEVQAEIGQFGAASRLGRDEAKTSQRDHDGCPELLASWNVETPVPEEARRQVQSELDAAGLTGRPSRVTPGG